MATAKSDEDDEQRPHPHSQERPGAYAHVVGGSRRRGVARAESGEVAIENALLEPITVPGETVEIERESGVRLEGTAGSIPPEPSSENTNHRADLMIVNLPGPPRVPSIDLSGDELPGQRSASLLDAPHSLRPETHAPRSGPSWLLLGCAAVSSAIIAAAAVVALRQPPEQPATSIALPEAPAREPEPAMPSGFARYAAEDAARHKAELAAAEAARAQARAVASPDPKLPATPAASLPTLPPVTAPARKARVVSETSEAKAPAQAPADPAVVAAPVTPDPGGAAAPVPADPGVAAPPAAAAPEPAVPVPAAPAASGEAPNVLPPNPYAQ